MISSTFDDGTHRFSPVDSNDHAGYIWIVTVLGLVYSGLAGLARARIKWGVHGADDYLLGVATILLFGQSSVIIYGLNRGLAKSNAVTLESDWALAGKSFFSSELLSVAILCLAKCSVVALVLRVFAIHVDRTWFLCVGTLALSAAWGLGSMVALGVDCDANTILTSKQVTTCPSQYTRWQAITAVDVLTELCICALPIVLVWPSQLSRPLKFQVFLAFVFRLPLVGLSALHLALFKGYSDSFLPPSTTSSGEQPQLAVARSLLLQQVMLAYSLISATVPNLKSFMRSFSVGLGVSLGFIPRAAGGPLDDLESSTGKDAYCLTQTQSRRPGTHRRSTGNPSQRRRSIYPGDESEEYELRTIFRPGHVMHRVTIKGSLTDDELESAGPAASGEDERPVSRSGSQDMIIKKEVVWDVYHEQLDAPSH